MDPRNGQKFIFRQIDEPVKQLAIYLNCLAVWEFESLLKLTVTYNSLLILSNTFAIVIDSHMCALHLKTFK